ncbi:MAG: EamA family transporter, partial [Gelidibacter sp.]
MYILLSVLASTFIFILFKVLGTYKIDTSKAIVINYLTACLFGFFIHPKPIDIADIATEKWFYGAILLGFLFIIVFNVMAITAQKNGLSVASVASKMSLVIPVVSGILIYGEALNSTLIIGIVLALLSVYLTASKSNTATNLRQNLMFPIFLFVGTGVIDTSIKFIQVSSLAKDDISIFSASIFCFAALFGLLQL